jgi:hypothetical protein
MNTKPFALHFSVKFAACIGTWTSKSLTSFHISGKKCDSGKNGSEELHFVVSVELSEGSEL